MPCWADMPANLLVNGGAEDGTDKTIANWTFVSGGLTPAQLTYCVSPDAAEGKQSFRIALTEPVGANVWWVQECTLPPNTKSLAVSFSGKQKTDDARTKWAVPSVGCYFGSKAVPWIGYQALRTVAPSDTWVKYSANVNVPPGAERIGLRLTVGSMGIVDALYDDVKIAPSETYANELLNGDIEDGAANWTVKRATGNAQQLVADVATDAADGKKALRLSSSDPLLAIHGAWMQSVPTVIGITAYTVSLKAKIHEGAGDKHADATVGYAFLNEKGREIGYLPFGIVTGKTWDTYTAKINAPADAASIEVRLCLDGTGPTDAYFDGVKVVPSH